MTLLYQCRNGSNVIVKARLFFDDPVLEWDVRTDQIFVGDGQGKELTVNFASTEILNKGIFYTDSNGLEMRERTLLFRYGNATTGNISASFYPVTSSIALRDTEPGSLEQLTVMTTRTQGASATREGVIELVHARRLLFDDSYSKEIILNDTDIASATQSTYYVQIYDRQYERSLQRHYQLTEVDSPLEYFFNFDYWMNIYRIVEEPQPMLFSANASELADMGFPPMVRIEVTPINTTFFFIRMENLDDLFEHHKDKSYFVDLEKVARHLSHRIFPKGVPHGGVPLSIWETSLSGTETYQDMVNEKNQWNGVDDETLDLSGAVRDKSSTLLYLGPQRIRKFGVLLDLPEAVKLESASPLESRVF